MTRIAVLALMASVLLPGTSVHAQSADRVQELIRALDSDEGRVRSKAIADLVALGPKATPAVPNLIELLRTDPENEVRFWATIGLLRLKPGEQALPVLRAAVGGDSSSAVRAYAVVGLATNDPEAKQVVPDLVAALHDSDEQVRKGAAEALATLGRDAKARGVVLWWVVARVYWLETLGLLAVLAIWFALAGRFPRHRPASKSKHLALVAATAAVSAGLSCSAAYWAITREWALGFLPETLTLIPFPVASVLTVGFVCALTSVWVCQRKSEAPSEFDESAS